ncbi:MAG: response regulator [Pirellulaceae bacterium]
MKIMDSGRPANVLLVEDNDDDVVLTRKGFERANFSVNLYHVSNGRDCLAFLRKQGEYASSPTPDLILLDLNMPIMDGREALSEIVRDGQLCSLPVVILTTSDAERTFTQIPSEM